MITSRGIYNDLQESIYTFRAYGFIFYFSSEFYRKKFKENVVNYVKNETSKLIGYYRINNNFDSFLAIAYYKKIEKRGFRIIIDTDFRKEYKENEVSFIASIL